MGEMIECSNAVYMEAGRYGDGSFQRLSVIVKSAQCLSVPSEEMPL